MSFQVNLGSEKDVPPEVRGWNWGAFFLTWIWGVCNGTLISLLSLIPGIHFVMMFVLGAKGNEWAWSNKEWDSVEAFHRSQKKWAAWGLGLWIATGFFIIVVPVGILGWGISSEWHPIVSTVKEFEDHRRFCNYALAEAERDPRCSRSLGYPLRVEGKPEAVRRNGYTESCINVYGPRGHGRLFVRSRKPGNAEAELESAELELESLERLRIESKQVKKEIASTEKRISELVAAVRKENRWKKREPNGKEEAEEFYREVLKKAESDPRVGELTGQLVSAQLEDAHVAFEGPQGEASFLVALEGRKQTAFLKIEGQRSLGHWNLRLAQLDFEGRSLNLLEQGQ